METREKFRDEKKENLSRRVSFWLSFLGGTVMTCWYCWLNPVESTEVQKMRLFFKENIIDVAKFIRLPREELEEFAKSKNHPFYQTYLKSSELERDKVKALIHMSRDYTPNQYWFNIFRNHYRRDNRNYNSLKNKDDSYAPTSSSFPQSSRNSCCTCSIHCSNRAEFLWHRRRGIN